MCALILWRSGSGLFLGKFRQFLTELFAHNTSVFSFQANNLSKSQKIFTKLDIKKYISSIVTELFVRHYNGRAFYFHVFIAHLSHSDKVSFCDHILSIDCRACVRPSVLPVRKQFLQMTSPPKPLIGF